MAHTLGSGDRLARGAVSASYTVTEKKITQSAWDQMFGDFELDEFLKKPGTEVATPGAERESSSTGVKSINAG